MDPISVIVILLAAYGIAVRIPAIARARDTAVDNVAGKLNDWQDAAGKAVSIAVDDAAGTLNGWQDSARHAAGWPFRAVRGWWNRSRGRDAGGGAGGTDQPGQTPPNAADGGTGDPGTGAGPTGTPDPADPQPGQQGSPDPAAEPAADPGDIPDAGPDPAGGTPPPFNAGEATVGDPDNPDQDNDPAGDDPLPPLYVGEAIVGSPRPEPPTTSLPSGEHAAIGSTATAVLEGTKPMSDLATRGGHVTGVVSGAAEARAIERQVRAVTENFVAQLNGIQSRLYALGDATLGIVQFAGTSDVVAACAGAAEALASAKGTASSVTGEVSASLLQVAARFDARNS